MIREREQMQGVRQIEDVEKRKAVIGKILAEIVEPLEPGQRDRLDQITNQLSGPEAFLGEDFQKRLGLSSDQVEKIRPIVEQGRIEMSKSTVIPLPTGLTFENRPGAFEALRKQLDTPEFRTVAAKARRDTKMAWDSTIQQIGRVLTDAQRTSYENSLGPSFDARKLQAAEDDVQAAAEFIASRVTGRGQRADSEFDTKVAHPAYSTSHPTVLFDEAHHNFHTADGRYKPFADLMGHDGYRVVPNREKFTRSSLAKADILVIANALGAEGMGTPGAEKSAFTNDECEIVRDWVRDGGALLLISDHPPMGSAAAELSRQFGVEMSQGVAIDPENSDNAPSRLVFSRENTLLRDHPITQGRNEAERVNRIMTFTGQSLRGPEGSVAFLKLGNNASDRGAGDGKMTSASGRSQGLALTFGKGRVVVLGEAGQLSAQVVGPTRRPMGMNVPGIDNRQLALNIMHWLSGLIGQGRD
jgi:hypothetical protein